MEKVNLLMLIHHIIIIALTAICSVLWVKVLILKKRIDRMESAGRISFSNKIHIN